MPVIASGGVGTLEHLRAGLVEGGADAALAASIFHDGVHTIAEAKEYLAGRGVPVRIAPRDSRRRREARDERNAEWVRDAGRGARRRGGARGLARAGDVGVPRARRRRRDVAPAVRDRGPERHAHDGGERRDDQARRDPPAPPGGEGPARRARAAARGLHGDGDARALVGGAPARRVATAASRPWWRRSRRRSSP